MREGSKVYFKEHDSKKQSRDIWIVKEILFDRLAVIFRDRQVQKNGVSTMVREEALEFMGDLEVFKL